MVGWPTWSIVAVWAGGVGSQPEGIERARGLSGSNLSMQRCVGLMIVEIDPGVAPLIEEESPQ